MSASIVIPAYNEAEVIERVLTALGAETNAIVVCNGCTDDTSGRARRVGGEFVRVIETAVASKSDALNLGDRAAAGFPRFYVDADIVVSRAAIIEVARVMAQRPGVLAAAPLIAFDLSARQWGVRAFYEIWSMLPYCRSGMIGAGIYALSEEGRKRFDRFPNITADDEFVRLHFAPHERLTVETSRFTVIPPTTLAGVIKITTRAHFGEYELRVLFPHLSVNKRDHHGGALRELLKRPGLWPKLAVYLYVRCASRLLAYHRWYFGDHRTWERDETSRLPGSAVAPVEPS